MMGGSKVFQEEEEDDQMKNNCILPRTLSMSNFRKTFDIQRELDRDVARSNDKACPLLFFQIMAVFMVIVPKLESYTRSVKEKIMQVLFDLPVLRKLEDARVINWCSVSKKQYVLWTRGDGNCLPHAVSLCLWGIHDENLFLRGLIHETLTENATAVHFRSRWQYARRYLNSTIPEGGLQYDSQEWDREWTMVVDLASSLRQDDDPNNLPYHSLEEIHIFVLANLIRRPIVILSEGVIRRMDGSSLAPNDIGGVYLPTLCSPQACGHSPVMICYDCNHFMPLISFEETSSNDNSPCEYAIPIVTNDLATLPVHFLSESEELEVPQLLEKYLNLVELRWTQTGHAQVDEVLSVAILPKKLPSQWNLMGDFCAIIENDMMNEQQNRRAVEHRGVQNMEETGTRPAMRLAGTSFTPSPERLLPVSDVAASGKRPAVHVSCEVEQEHSPVPLAVEALLLATMKSCPCITPGCEFHGLPENGGRCSGCVKEFTKDTDQTEETLLKQAESPALKTRFAQGERLKRTVSCQETSSRSVQNVDPKLFDVCSVASIDHRNCVENKCDILTSGLSYPYCLNHKPRGAIISTFKEDAEQMSGSMSAYYARIVSPETSSESHTQSHSLESVRHEFTKKCLVGNCTKYGDPQKRNMCSIHNEGYMYSEKIKKEPKKNIFLEKSASTTSREQRTGQGQQLCQNIRCALDGWEDYQGYCRQCFTHRESLQGEFSKGSTMYQAPQKPNTGTAHNESYASSQKTLKKHANEVFSKKATPNKAFEQKRSGGLGLRMCRNMRCAQDGLEKCQGYCQECFKHLDVVQNQQNEQQLNLMETCQEKPTDLPKTLTMKTEDVMGITRRSTNPTTIGSNTTGIAYGSVPRKLSNLSISEQPLLPSTKRSHQPLSDKINYKQQEIPTEKCRRTFLQCHNVQQEKLSLTKPLPCQAEGCCSVQLRDSEMGLCLRCENKLTQRQASTISQYQGLTDFPTTSGLMLPLVSHSSPLPSERTTASKPSTSSSSIPTMKYTSYEREMQGEKCNFAACDNLGLKATNGLCQECFDVLANKRHNSNETKPQTMSASTSMTIPLPAHNSATGVHKQCKTVGCEMYGIPETNDQCSKCYSAKQNQDFVSDRYRDYEVYRHSSQPVVGMGRLSPSQFTPEPLSPSITASPCMERHCTNFGDPAFNGFCSRCFAKSGYQAPGYDLTDVPVSYKLPPVSAKAAQVCLTNKPRQPSYSDGIYEIPAAGDLLHKIAKCKNHRVTGCTNYGNVNCRKYCNSCYVDMRSRLH